MHKAPAEKFLADDIHLHAQLKLQTHHNATHHITFHCSNNVDHPPPPAPHSPAARNLHRQQHHHPRSSLRPTYIPPPRPPHRPPQLCRLPRKRQNQRMLPLRQGRPLRARMYRAQDVQQLRLSRPPAQGLHRGLEGRVERGIMLSLWQEGPHGG